MSLETLTDELVELFAFRYGLGNKTLPFDKDIYERYLRNEDFREGLKRSVYQSIEAYGIDHTVEMLTGLRLHLLFD